MRGKFTLPEGMAFIVLAGSLTGDDDVWMALLPYQVEAELSRLKSLRAENEMLVFLNEMP